MRYWLPLLIPFAMILDLGCTSPAFSLPAGVPFAAVSLPSTPLVALDGTATDLRTVLRGRVAVVSLWATWCEACVDEIDGLERLQAQADARGDAVVVGVAVGERRETVAAFARKRGLLYARLVDEDFRLADALGEARVPATLVVDHDGRIVFRGGALDSAALTAFRRALGAGPKD
jgi:peroxiredoxin